MSESEPTVPAEQASRMVARSAVEVGTLKRAVESQQLRLDPAAGEQIRSMLDEHIAKVDAWLRQTGDLARHAPLGENPVGTAMAEKFASRADGDETSFAGVLRRYREVLQEAQDAVGDAMRTYHEVDAHAADSLDRKSVV